MTLPITTHFILTTLVIAQTSTIVILLLLLMQRQRIERSAYSALQGWYVEQSKLLEHHAHTIRDSALQELFALRRSLEIAELQFPQTTETQKYQTWIQQLEALYSSLNSIVEVLSPPLTEANLPSAALAYLKQKNAEHENFTISVNQCSEWASDAPNTNKLMLAFIQGLVEQIIANESAKSIVLEFIQETNIKQLEIKLRTVSSKFDADYQEYIFDACQVLSALAGIEYSTTLKKYSLRIHLKWQSGFDPKTSLI